MRIPQRVGVRAFLVDLRRDRHYLYIGKCLSVPSFSIQNYIRRSRDNTIPLYRYVSCLSLQITSHLTQLVITPLSPDPFPPRKRGERTICPTSPGSTALSPTQAGGKGSHLI